MKKNRKPVPPPEPSTAAAAAATFVPAAADNLKAPIHEHSLFFDRLVDLIPARFYLPTADEEKPWFQGLSRAARAAAKKETRENIKKARRARLDPRRASTTLDLLLEKSKAEEAGENPSGGDADADAEDPAAAAAVARDDRAVTYEELRERLHRRIEELRSNRNTNPSNKPKVEKVEKKKKGDAASGKRKREEKSEGGGEGTVDKKKQKSETKNERDASSVELSFGHVRLGDKDDKGRNKKKLSKLQELEKVKQLEEAKRDTEKGETVSRKHSWKAAVSRAAGSKVHDDPKLLKESLKKEKKRRQKNALKWKERIASRDNVRSEKQKTRTDNIKGRIQQKKLRKIEKREKKLMRPGFEGRKDGYINEP